MPTVIGTIRKASILFPHTHIRPKDLEGVLRHFRPLSLCLPWHMESPFSRADSPYASSVMICRPPPSLKPPDDFGALLSGYMGWAQAHREGGYAAFIKAIQDGMAREKTSWEIGRMIRGENAAARDVCGEKALEWHLLLHLAHEIEENRNGAADLLRRVKNMKSPLEEALDEDFEGQNLLADLPPFSSDPPTPAQRLDRILEAFVGLFGDHLQAHDVLFTLDPGVVTHLRERFGDALEEVIGVAPEAAAPECRLTGIKLGELKATPEGERNPVSVALSRKTIVLMETGQ